MTCHSELDANNWVRDGERDKQYTRDPHSVGVWNLKRIWKEANTQIFRLIDNKNKNSNLFCFLKPYFRFLFWERC